MTWPWGLEGQDLRPEPDARARKPLTVCLNVWNDLAELESHADSWWDLADRVIAVDGAYEGVETDNPASTDGTLDWLAARGAQIVEAQGFWPDQIAKRNAYFRLGSPGDWLLVIDADEEVGGLAGLPECDVGWVAVTSPLYQRAQHQPRLFRWTPGIRYEDRHHWIRDDRGPICTHQQGAPARHHVLLDLTLHNCRGRCRSSERRQAVGRSRMAQTDQELTKGPKTVGHEPLRILQVGPFDAGNVVHRLHTAVNATTPHESAMGTGHLGPFDPPRQYDLEADVAILRDLAVTADVIHYHVTRVLDGFATPRPDAARVMHHHGTEYRRDPLTWNQRDADCDLRLISNLELAQYGEGLHYLPNPVPVGQWRRDPFHVKHEPFVVGHSPTKRDLKGTEAFLRACERVPGVEPLLIEQVTLRDSMEAKRHCHAFFDSFWLGMQCSGLEAAAIGMPVIAGDPDVASAYRQWLGDVPYTYADDEAGLVAALERLAHDRAFWEAECARVAGYVLNWHDYGAVTARYLDLLEEAIGWRTALQLGNPIPYRRAGPPSPMRSRSSAVWPSLSVPA